MGKRFNPILVCGNDAKERLRKAIIGIGENLIEKADEICSDIELMNELEIKAIITPAKVVDYSITKKYYATFNKEEVNQDVYIESK